MSMRLDLALVERGLVETRNRAKTAIADGHVLVNGLVCLKPAFAIAPTDVLQVTEAMPFVGRGGFKLAFGLSQFQLSLQGLSCLDIGASTGGFTDCMLQNGASHVLAVDVGHEQFAPALRADPRVTLLEGTDIRNLPPDTAGLPVQFAACDVSFISLTHILPLLSPLLTSGANAILLVKPQFEAGRAAIGKGGVVRDSKVHAQILRTIRNAAAQVGLLPCADCPSPIQGGSGNTEFLLLLEKP